MKNMQPETEKSVVQQRDELEKKLAFGHLVGKRANTHWMCFVKTPTVQEQK